MELKTPNEWQFVDPSNGFLFPWFVLPFLELLAQWDISQWDVFEAGSGASTLWWASKCRHVVTLEVRSEWIERLGKFAESHDIKNIDFNLVEEDYLGHLDPIKYMGVLEQQRGKFDAIIIDGSYRDKMCVEALNHIKDGGLYYS